MYSQLRTTTSWGPFLQSITAHCCTKTFRGAQGPPDDTHAAWPGTQRSPQCGLVPCLPLQPNWLNHNPLSTSFIILDSSPTTVFVVIVVVGGQGHPSNWNLPLLLFIIQVLVQVTNSPQSTECSVSETPETFPACSNLSGIWMSSYHLYMLLLLNETGSFGEHQQGHGRLYT